LSVALAQVAVRTVAELKPFIGGYSAYAFIG